MATRTEDPWILRGGIAPGIAAGIVTGTIALVLTGDWIRGLTFFLGAGIVFAVAPRLRNTFRAFVNK